MKDEALEPTPKDVFRLRMYFSDFMTPEQLKTQLSRPISCRETIIILLLFPAPRNLGTSWCLKELSCGRNPTLHGLKTVLHAVRRRKHSIHKMHLTECISQDTFHKMQFPLKPKSLLCADG